MWTDVLPLLLFFGFYKWKGIYAATGSAIAAGIFGAIYRYRKEGKLEPMPLFTLALIVILGGLTIYLKDPRFLIWKVSISYTAMALFFVNSCRAGQTPMLKNILGSAMTLPDERWRSGTWAYVGYFLFAATLNLVVANLVSLDTWVKYKVFGTIVLSMGFMVSHTMWLSGKQLPEAAADAETVADAVVSEP
jgi:intracellular septation protein